MAGQEPACDLALHSDELLVVEHGGDLLRDHHPASHPPRGSFASVRELLDAIGRFIEAWN